MPKYELCFVRVLNIDACGQALKHLYVKNVGIKAIVSN
jgi:hypothetical protein